MMMNCFCGMVDQKKKAFSLIYRREHCQRSSTSRIYDKPRAGFETALNLSSDFAEWSCAVVITNTPRRLGKGHTCFEKQLYLRRQQNYRSYLWKTVTHSKEKGTLSAKFLKLKNQRGNIKNRSGAKSFYCSTLPATEGFQQWSEEKLTSLNDFMGLFLLLAFNVSSIISFFNFWTATSHALKA